MSKAMSDPEFRQVVVTLLGDIAEDVNEILEHLRWNRENSDGPLASGPGQLSWEHVLIASTARPQRSARFLPGQPQDHRGTPPGFRGGLPPGPIVPGPGGAPQWPPGVVGSITHCAGYRACVVARARDVLTIGLDAEPHDALPDGVLGAIAHGDEEARLAELAATRPDVCWDRILFCAKESVYKAWFPLTQRWLGFAEASVAIDPVNRTFAARLLVDGPVVDGAVIGGFEGRWLVRDGLILAAIVVTADGRGASWLPGHQERIRPRRGGWPRWQNRLRHGVPLGP